MLAVVLATFIPSLKPAAPPPEIVARRAPALIGKVDKQQEASASLERMLEGLQLASDTPVMLKPAFNGGPGAALSVKF